MATSTRSRVRGPQRERDEQPDIDPREKATSGRRTQLVRVTVLALAVACCCAYAFVNKPHEGAKVAAHGSLPSSACLIANSGSTWRVHPDGSRSLLTRVSDDCAARYRTAPDLLAFPKAYGGLGRGYNFDLDASLIACAQPCNIDVRMRLGLAPAAAAAAPITAAATTVPAAAPATVSAVPRRPGSAWMPERDAELVERARQTLEK